MLLLFNNQSPCVLQQVFFRHYILSLAICNHRQRNSTKNCQEPQKASLLHIITSI